MFTPLLMYYIDLYFRQLGTFEYCPTFVEYEDAKC